MPTQANPIQKVATAIQIKKLCISIRRGESLLVGDQTRIDFDVSHRFQIRVQAPAEVSIKRVPSQPRINQDLP